MLFELYIVKDYINESEKHQILHGIILRGKSWGTSIVSIMFHILNWVLGVQVLIVI